MESNTGKESKMRTRKVNADLMTTKRVQRAHGGLEDLEGGKGIFNPNRIYTFDVPTSSTASSKTGEKSRKVRATEKRSKAKADAKGGIQPIQEGAKLTSLKTPFLQDIFLEQGHKFSESLVQQLDKVPGEGKKDDVVVPDPSKLDKMYGDSDLQEMITSLNLKTSQEAITFFARHGSSTPLKFVNCVQPVDTGK
eukprot:CAMPEP_0184502686 /NCGR_PEP_ID=MMETSP0113_2-20130426/51010_1 /TAXON_ID=91329 /ORGANISM="Norrisiella sphaerica, Strain BC52" /LENGTH=193 /DNA_ID=CAMNT_0026891973 /DNA_START=81 /DNA_END=659 /DNA_ORIENTATION=+